MAEQNPEEINATFEELDLLQSEFEDVELELIRKTEALHAPLYKKRAELAAKIPHFWALVLEQSPPELDTFFQPSDSSIFAECLKTVNVSRFELDDPKGSPRSFAIEFGFGENSYFEDKVLAKKFWFRRSSDGWQGHVSEPVKINWKKDQDLTGGLTDAAYNLLQAKTKLAKEDSKAKETTLPEYKALASKIEQSEDASNSFFAWFAFASSYRWVSAEESERAFKVEAERKEKIRKGEKVEEEEEPAYDNEQDFQETEVFPQGDEIAALIADEMWPSAIKYYKHAHEADDEDLSEIDEDFDDEDDSDEEIDIRGLVGKGRNSKSKLSDSPPPKRQRQT
ncbi:hypothetical protein K505DRAFT_377046 [Melanomma pulvis-pyrius CBS 109.77]|uniref:NAP family protein n=1 Tax=Melanomma pulvis-pyrius CBS 109.77 TaxID=1314802 RepID=A0A6A6X432_9PLEO|nr:hypothetical protein K505DRAFT_377046 [Melanomma pulvis-pyrius CBS 109.77]